MSAAPPPGERHFSAGEFVALPFVLAFLLFLVQAHQHDGWGLLWQGVFLVIVLAVSGGALWDLASRARRRAATALPAPLLVGIIVLYGVVPLAGWWLLVFGRHPAGVLLPLVPAGLLGASVGVAAVRERFTRR
jgi:hypothetical protein